MIRRRDIALDGPANSALFLRSYLESKLRPEDSARTMVEYNLHPIPLQLTWGIGADSSLEERKLKWTEVTGALNVTQYTGQACSVVSAVHMFSVLFLCDNFPLFFINFISQNIAENSNHILKA